MLASSGTPGFIGEPSAKAVLEMSEMNDDIVGTWTFDHVFPPEISTQEILKSVGTPLLERVLEGHNGTVR